MRIIHSLPLSRMCVRTRMLIQSFCLISARARSFASAQRDAFIFYWPMFCFFPYFQHIHCSAVNDRFVGISRGVIALCVDFLWFCAHNILRHTHSAEQIGSAYSMLSCLSSFSLFKSLSSSSSASNSHDPSGMKTHTNSDTVNIFIIRATRLFSLALSLSLSLFYLLYGYTYKLQPRTS